MVSSTNLPLYVADGVGLSVPRAPYDTTDAQVASFLLGADYEQLESICDQYLNIPQGEKPRYKYRPLLPYTMLAYADLLGNVLNDQEQPVGKLREIDIGFWVLTLALKRIIGGLYVPSHLAWFMPTLYVDSAIAMTSGREVFGFNKNFALVQRPKDISAPEYSLETVGWKQYNPEVEGQMLPLLKVQQLTEPDENLKAQTWQNKAEAREGIIKVLTQNDEGKVTVDWLDDIIDLLIDFFKPEVQMVFLKQFRDVADSGKAGYQVIAEAPGVPTDFKGGGLIHGDYEVSINYLESSPIAQQLGLKLDEGGKIKPIAGFWLNFAFVFQQGEIIKQISPE